MTDPQITGPANELRDKLLREYEADQALYQRVEATARQVLDHALIPLRSRATLKYDRIEILSRVKSFPSAYDKVLRTILDPEARAVEREDIARASLNTLNDMVGLTIGVFPNKHIPEAERLVRISESVRIIGEDHKVEEYGRPAGSDRPPLDYYDKIDMLKFLARLAESCGNEVAGFTFEIQIKSYLLAVYHDIEHDILYKPYSRYVAQGTQIPDRLVVNAIKNFCGRFEELMHDVPR